MKTSFLAVLSLSGCLLLQTGCVTRNLWEQTYFVPARPSNLRLFESAQPPGVVVEYNERIAGGKPTARRAYLLQPDAQQPPGSIPVFIPPHGEADGLKPIPILRAGAPGTLPPPTGYQAVERPEEHQFVLYRDGECQGTWKLPFYRKTTHSVSRAILTPVAVVADTTFTAATWAVIAGGAVAAGVGPVPGGPPAGGCR